MSTRTDVWKNSFGEDVFFQKLKYGDKFNISYEEIPDFLRYAISRSIIIQNKNLTRHISIELIELAFFPCEENLNLRIEGFRENILIRPIDEIRLIFHKVPPEVPFTNLLEGAGPVKGSYIRYFHTCQNIDDLYKI